MSRVIHTVIFSKDRAMQLDALLQSMQRYASALLPARVLVRCDTPGNFAAYQQLAAEHLADVAVQIQGNNFKSDFCGLLRETSASMTMLLVDDDVFYRPMPLDLLNGLLSWETFSTRLGANCHYCYATDSPQSPGTLDFLRWASLDGNVYRTRDVRALAEMLAYDNPNQLEDRMDDLNVLRGREGKLRWAPHSSLVNIPHNRVGDYETRSAGGSADELCARYLEGDRIDLDAMDFTSVIGPHQEIPFAFRKVEVAA